MAKWIISTDGIAVDEIVAGPRQVTINHIAYPAEVFRMWSETELNDASIYIVTESPQPVDPNVIVNPPQYVREGRKFIETWPTTARTVDSLRTEGNARIDAWQNESLRAGVTVNGASLPSDTQSGFRAMLALQSGGENASIIMTSLNGAPVTLNADALQAYTQALHDLQEAVDTKVRTAMQIVAMSTTYQQVQAAVASLSN